MPLPPACSSHGQVKANLRQVSLANGCKIASFGSEMPFEDALKPFLGLFWGCFVPAEPKLLKRFYGFLEANNLDEIGRAHV